MTSKERLRAAADHRRIDRPCSSLRCTSEAWTTLRDHLGVSTNQEALDELDIDMRWVRLPFIGPAERSGATLGSEGTDFWGCHTREVKTGYNSYFEFDYHPLADACSPQEVADHDWPDIEWWNYPAIQEQIDEACAREPRSILFFAGGAFETPWYMRGMERFLMDLHEHPDIQEEICTRVADYYIARAERVLDVAKGVDLIGSGGDIGTQRGMMVSPDMWRKRIKKHTQRLITPFRDKGCMTFYHSCGSVVEVIEDFIGMGLHFLDPVQVGAAGMDPENLAARFGGRIGFHGAIDEQELLPNASAAEVYEETIRTIDILGAKSPIIVSPCHQVQGDTPPENVVAVFDAVRDYPNR